MGEPMDIDLSIDEVSPPLPLSLTPSKQRTARFDQWMNRPVFTPPPRAPTPPSQRWPLSISNKRLSNWDTEQDIRVSPSSNGWNIAVEPPRPAPTFGSRLTQATPTGSKYVEDPSHVLLLLPIPRDVTPTDIQQYCTSRVGPVSAVKLDDGVATIWFRRTDAWRACGLMKNYALDGRKLCAFVVPPLPGEDSAPPLWVRVAASTEPSSGSHSVWPTPATTPLASPTRVQTPAKPARRAPQPSPKATAQPAPLPSRPWNPQGTPKGSANNNGGGRNSSTTSRTSRRRGPENRPATSPSPPKSSTPADTSKSMPPPSSKNAAANSTSWQAPAESEADAPGEAARRKERGRRGSGQVAKMEGLMPSVAADNEKRDAQCGSR